jgi:hypothetical protein
LCQRYKFFGGRERRTVLGRGAVLEFWQYLGWCGWNRIGGSLRELELRR